MVFCTQALTWASELAAMCDVKGKSSVAVAMLPLLR